MHKVYITGEMDSFLIDEVNVSEIIIIIIQLNL